MKLKNNEVKLSIMFPLPTPFFYSNKEASSESWSLEKVKNTIEALTHRLLNFKFKTQSHVILIGENSIQYFIAIQAIRAAGHVAVPINKNTPLVKLHQIIADLNAVLLFCDKNYPLESQINQVSFLSDFFSLDKQSYPKITKLPLDRISLIIHTSGTAGQPKRVAISEKARRSFVLSQLILKNSKTSTLECTLVSSPLSHVLANNILESAYALKESAVVLSKFEPSSYLESIEKYGVTKISLVPSMLSLLLQNLEEIKKRNLNSVKHIYFSSEPLHQNLIEDAHFYFKNATIENCYGISEVGPNLFGPHPQGLKRPELSVGHPRKGFEYRLVNSELEIKSPFMMKGYFDQDLLTKSALTEDGFFRTKDLFSVDKNGFYYHQGRKDDLIITGGINISPTEIENIISSCPGVIECAVIKLKDDIKNERAFAFVIKSNNVPLNEEGLKKHMLLHGEPHLIPKNIFFIEKMPINENMKIDRAELKKWATNKIG